MLTTLGSTLSLERLCDHARRMSRRFEHFIYTVNGVVVAAAGGGGGGGGCSSSSSSDKHVFFYTAR